MHDLPLERESGFKRCVLNTSFVYGVLRSGLRLTKDLISRLSCIGPQEHHPRFVKEKGREKIYILEFWYTSAIYFFIIDPQ